MTAAAKNRAKGETGARAPRPCPICGRPAVAAHRPFCSPRCRTVDLGRWLKGVYVIPGRPPGYGEEDAS